jgi:glycosyltransferase involved in cell wall biosynthesis
MPGGRSVRRIRIMLVLEATDGGTGRHVEEAIAALGSEEFELHVVCSTRRSPRFRDAIRLTSHRVTVLPMVRRPDAVLDPFCLFRLRRLLREWPCDVLYLHSSKAGFLGRIAALSWRGKVVYAPHAPYFLRRDGLASWPGLFRRAERLFASRVDVLHAVSRAEATIMVENGIYDENRIFVLKNAIDISTLRARLGSRDSVRWANRQRTIGFIGALRRQKAPLLFLRAVRRALALGLDARFLLPASGPQLDQCRRYVARHRLHANVEFLPAAASLHELYRRLDIAVLPSLWEGLPYTILEAMALQLPVIASDLPVFRELIASTEPELLFSTGDADALADRLIFWAGRPASDIERVTTRLSERVRREHDWSAWREQLREFVRGLAAEARGI